MSSPTSVFSFPDPYIPFISRDRCWYLSESYSRYTSSQNTSNTNDLEFTIARLLDCEIWKFQVRDLRGYLEDHCGPYGDSLDRIWRCVDDWRIEWNQIEGYD